MHKIAVLGTITKDTIICPDKKTEESLGGILYNILALSVLGKNSVKVYPVCNVGYDIHNKVLRVLKEHQNIDSAAVKKVETKNQHNSLYYQKDSNREEISKNFLPRLTYSQIKQVIDSDVILVNFISGSDIDLRSLMKLRTKSWALVFMDIHSLVLGRARNGKRFVKVPKNWRGWIGCADIVQCNFAEFCQLSGRMLTKSAEIRNFARSIILSGPEILLVTRGQEKGYVFQAAKRGIKFNRSSVPPFKGIKDPTGCGDVFSAGFLISHLKSNNPLSSANFGNSVATYKCKFLGIESLSMLSKLSL